MYTVSFLITKRVSEIKETVPLISSFKYVSFVKIIAIHKLQDEKSREEEKTASLKNSEDKQEEGGDVDTSKNQPRNESGSKEATVSKSAENEEVNGETKTEESDKEEQERQQQSGRLN